MRPHRGMAGLARRFAGDTSGVTALITAMVVTTMMGFSAFAVDMGYVYLQNRKLQGIADLAAMAAAQDIGNARLAADRTVRANQWRDPVKIVVVTGRYEPDPNQPAARRFVAGGAKPNAAQVTLSSSASLFFASSLVESGTVALSRTATATSAEMASFSIGSRLASVQGGVANALLSALTGSNVTLSVMDYNSLLNANVDLFSYMDALRTRLDVEAGSFNSLLRSDVSAADSLAALSIALNAKGLSDAAGAIDHIASAASGASGINLSQIVDVGAYGGQDQASSGGGIQMNAMDLANAVLTSAQAGRQLKLDSGVTVPGLAKVEVWLAIGERPNNSPWLTVTSKGEPVIRTAQTRLYLKISIGGVLKALGVASVELPIFVELASAEAKLSAIECPANVAARRVVLSVRPSVGHASIAEIDTDDLDDFKTPLKESPATLLATIGVKATAQARTDVGGAAWQNVSFKMSEIKAMTIKTVDTTDIAATLGSTLIGNLDIEVKVLGLGIGLGASAIKQSLASTLAAVGAPIDNVINTVTGLLGVHLGQADVRVTGLRCNAPALVL